LGDLGPRTCCQVLWDFMPRRLINIPTFRRSVIPSSSESGSPAVGYGLSVDVAERPRRRQSLNYIDLVEASLCNLNQAQIMSHIMFGTEVNTESKGKKEIDWMYLKSSRRTQTANKTW